MKQADSTKPATGNNKYKLITACCVLIIFMHAFAIIICKDQHRRLFIKVQHSMSQQQTLRNTWGKLLLEYSTLDAPIRIQQQAGALLNMQFPESTKLLILPATKTTGDATNE